jgi:hypothetical protein
MEALKRNIGINTYGFGAPAEADRRTMRPSPIWLLVCLLG